MPMNVLVEFRNEKTGEVITEVIDASLDAKQELMKMHNLHKSQITILRVI